MQLGPTALEMQTPSLPVHYMFLLLLKSGMKKWRQSTIENQENLVRHLFTHNVVSLVFVLAVTFAERLNDPSDPTGEKLDKALGLRGINVIMNRDGDHHQLIEKHHILPEKFPLESLTEFSLFRP